MLSKKLNNLVPVKVLIAGLLSLASLSSFSAFAASHTISDGNFTMLTGVGGLVGGATDVNGAFDDTLICDVVTCNDISMTLASAEPFFGVAWTAHDIRVFGPGTYIIDTDCTGEDTAAGRIDCDPSGVRPSGTNSNPVVTDVTLGGGIADTVEGPNFTLTVPQNQLAAHILFNYSNSTNIHVPVLWSYHSAFGAPIYNTTDATHTDARVWNLNSIDVDGDTYRGFAMVNGPFVGFHANFSLDLVDSYTPPVANDDATATPNILATIDVLKNDTDVEDGSPPVGATVTLLTATSAQGGTLLNNGDGTVDYTPIGLTLDVGDTDSFQYTITDSSGAVSNVATVNIAIATNNLPTANDVAFSTNEDIPKVIGIAVLDDVAAAIGIDGDGGTQTLSFATVQSPTNGGGIVTGGGTTSLTYTPAADFNGVDTFTFSVNDGFDDSLSAATMTLTVAAINDVPVCTDAELGTNPDKVLSIDVVNDLLSACTDVDVGDAIVLVSTTQPVEINSTLADDGAGTLTYTPAPAFIGADSFDFTVTDGVTATANIAVLNLGNFTMLDAQGKVFGGTNDVVFTWDGVSTNTLESDVDFNMTIVSDGAELFFGAPWFAHHIRVFGPGTYTFEANNQICQSKLTSPDAAKASTQTFYASADDIDVTGCPATGATGTLPITMTVLTGQLGVHMLFDYNGSFDIDVVNVWDIGGIWADSDGQLDSDVPTSTTLNDLWDGPAGVAPDPTGTWELVSRDVNGDGINGTPMIDGPFPDFYANFNDGSSGAGKEKDVITTEAGDTLLGGGVLNGAVLLLMLPLISLLRRRDK